MRTHSGHASVALVLTSVLMATAQSPGTTPVLVSPPQAIVNTSAPAANASVITVTPPETADFSSMLSNITFSSVGLDVGTAVSQFNASIPLQAENTTTPPLDTFNTSVASLLPQNSTQAVGKDNSTTLLIADPSWGKAILVNASSLNTTQLVVSNATDLGSATAFTTVYNTTTVRRALSSSPPTSMFLLSLPESCFVKFTGCAKH